MSPSFADLGVPEDVLTVLARKGVTEPFPIQAATLPDLLAGRDVCGRAPTGSGKTLAFGIPLVTRVGKGRPRKPRALVLSPTRELAEQIQKELSPLLATRQRKSVSVYGGVGYGGQRQALRKGVDVLVACPGRLEDLIGTRDVELDEVEIVVIDEADRMADMGFLPAVKRLLDATNPDRQTVLFSATLDGDVKVVTDRYQDRPTRHEVGDVEPDITTAQHLFWKVVHLDRRDHAVDVISAAGPTIVFCRTRRGADRLTSQLGKSGVKAAAIHGGRSQGQRDRALGDFTKGRVDALVATDVAARGIHVDGVACVLHYDPPEDDKTYLHRSGRTARAGATGLVVSFIRSEEQSDCKKLQRQLGLPGQITAPGPIQGDKPVSKRLEERSARPAKAVKTATDRGRKATETHAESHPEGAHERRRGGRKNGAPTGTVKFFDTRRGYGFIAVPGRDDLFVHHTNVTGSRGVLGQGEQVSFEIAQGRKGDEARNVRVV
jgi:superfamily II DNA/RNA helicase